MAERMLITKLVRTEPTRADLYAKGHQWPDLKLFELSDLLEVGIDPGGLEIGEEVPCRFWAIYELSEKLNQAGNPYKDVIALERVDALATATSTDTSALLEELRAIRALLEQVVQAQGGFPAAEAGDAPASDAVGPRYGDGSAVSDNPHEREAYEAYVAAQAQAPASVHALRRWAQDRPAADA
jgi:hypothetical protein